MTSKTQQRIIPDRWEDYSKVGDRIPGTRFVCFKVPLSEPVCHVLSLRDQWFTPADLLKIVGLKGGSLGLVIDLTNTQRYYDPLKLTFAGIEYGKVFCPGKDHPPLEKVKEFYDIIAEFEEKYVESDLLIGVHCTHGVNRTGYMVCRYLIEKCGFSCDEAVEKFTTARGHPIERREYLAILKEVERNPQLKEMAELPPPGLRTAGHLLTREDIEFLVTVGEKEAKAKTKERNAKKRDRRERKAAGAESNGEVLQKTVMPSEHNFYAGASREDSRINLPKNDSTTLQYNAYGSLLSESEAALRPKQPVLQSTSVRTTISVAASAVRALDPVPEKSASSDISAKLLLATKTASVVVASKANPIASSTSPKTHVSHLQVNSDLPRPASAASSTKDEDVDELEEGEIRSDDEEDAKKDGKEARQKKIANKGPTAKISDMDKSKNQLFNRLLKRKKPIDIVLKDKGGVISEMQAATAKADDEVSEPSSKKMAFDSGGTAVTRLGRSEAVDDQQIVYSAPATTYTGRQNAPTPTMDEEPEAGEASPAARSPSSKPDATAEAAPLESFKTFGPSKVKIPPPQLLTDVPKPFSFFDATSSTVGGKERIAAVAGITKAASLYSFSTPPTAVIEPMNVALSTATESGPVPFIKGLPKSPPPVTVSSVATSVTSSAATFAPTSSAPPMIAPPAMNPMMMMSMMNQPPMNAMMNPMMSANPMMANMMSMMQNSMNQNQMRGTMPMMNPMMMSMMSSMMQQQQPQPQTNPVAMLQQFTSLVQNMFMNTCQEVAKTATGGGGSSMNPAPVPPSMPMQPIPPMANPMLGMMGSGMPGMAPSPMMPAAATGVAANPFAALMQNMMQKLSNTVSSNAAASNTAAVASSSGAMRNANMPTFTHNAMPFAANHGGGLATRLMPPVMGSAVRGASQAPPSAVAPTDRLPDLFQNFSSSFTESPKAVPTFPKQPITSLQLKKKETLSSDGNGIRTALDVGGTDSPQPPLIGPILPDDVDSVNSPSTQDGEEGELWEDEEEEATSTAARRRQRRRKIAEKFQKMRSGRFWELHQDN